MRQQDRNPHGCRLPGSPRRRNLQLLSCPGVGCHACSPAEEKSCWGAHHIEGSCNSAAQHAIPLLLVKPKVCRWWQREWVSSTCDWRHVIGVGELCMQRDMLAGRLGMLRTFCNGRQVGRHQVLVCSKPPGTEQ